LFCDHIAAGRQGAHAPRSDPAAGRGNPGQFDQKSGCWRWPGAANVPRHSRIAKRRPTALKRGEIGLGFLLAPRIANQRALTLSTTTLPGVPLHSHIKIYEPFDSRKPEPVLSKRLTRSLPPSCPRMVPGVDCFPRPPSLLQRLILPTIVFRARTVGGLGKCR